MQVGELVEVTTGAQGHLSEKIGTRGRVILVGARRPRLGELLTLLAEDGEEFSTYSGWVRLVKEPQHG